MSVQLRSKADHEKDCVNYRITEIYNYMRECAKHEQPVPLHVFWELKPLLVSVGILAG